MTEFPEDLGRFIKKNEDPAYIWQVEEHTSEASRSWAAEAGHVRPSVRDCGHQYHKPSHGKAENAGS